MTIITLCALLTLAATPEPSAPPKLVLTGLNVVGIEPQLATFYSEHLANQMKLEGVEVITQTEIASLMGVERQRQLLGCSEQSSECMLELSNALGVDALVLGGIAKVGAGTQINLKVVRNTGKTVGVFSEFVADGSAVIAALNRAATSLSGQTARAMERTLVSTGPKPEVSTGGGGGGVRKWWWVPTAGGAVMSAVGVALFASGAGQAGALTDPGKPPLAYETAKSIASAGSTQQTAGVVLISVGAAAVAGGVAMLLFGSESSTTVALVPSANPTLVVGGRF